MKKLTIVSAQINLLVGDIEGNAERIVSVTNSAYRQHKADLILFPELAITGYPPEDLLFRPGLYQRVSEALQYIASHVNHATIIVGYPDSADGKNYNKAAVISDGKVLSTYAKHELPNYRVFDEKRYFFPGEEPCILNIKGTKLGILICEDLWFEKPIKQSVAAGAKMIVSINASPFAREKAHHRRDLLAEQAHTNKVPIVYLNLVGGQDELVFDGGSMVVDAKGKIVQYGKYFKEDLMVSEFDVAHNLEILTATPQAPELLDEEKIYNVLVLGVHDYVTKNGFPGALIGLSGGIDSALTLAIAVDALGKDHVQAVMMPSRFTSTMSTEDAKTQANNLDVKYSVIEIESVFNSVLKTLDKEFANLPQDTTEENIQARIRGLLLMALSNKKGSIVLTTGNKSEMAVGYTTLYGDMVGGFVVLKDVYKTMVYRLCRYRNTLNPIIPERVLERPPSAELAANQVDQDALPPYSVLDDIIHRYAGLDETPATIAAAGFDVELVKKIVLMINRNEYKRRQAPIGIRITERSFGKDRRYPITSGFTKEL